MEIYRKYFGHRLGIAIKDGGYNQTTFAEAVGVENPTVSRWVNGRDFPHEETFKTICRVLKLTPDYFVPIDSPVDARIELLGEILGWLAAHGDNEDLFRQVRGFLKRIDGEREKLQNKG